MNKVPRNTHNRRNLENSCRHSISRYNRGVLCASTRTIYLIGAPDPAMNSGTTGDKENRGGQKIAKYRNRMVTTIMVLIVTI